MSTEYLYRLHVVVRSQQVAQQLSALVYAEFPEVGPGNVSQELVNVGDADNATAVAWEFNQAVKQEYIAWLATLVSGMQLPPGTLWWVRTDRENNLQKRHDDENPTPRVFTAEDGRAECGLKLRRVSVY